MRVIHELALDQAWIWLAVDQTKRLSAIKAKQVILRSSTNAEDLSGFNGAGLYDSVSLAVRLMPPCLMVRVVG